MSKDKKKKLSLDEALEQDHINTFEGADAKDKEHKYLKSGVTDKSKKAGAPMQGKSKATNKIAFMVDDEQLEYLKSLLDYDKKLSSPNAVAKKLFVMNYEINGKKD